MENNLEGQGGWWSEKDLKFHFRGSNVMRIDKEPEMQEKPSCDFGVETGYVPYLLIEVKDPSSPHAPTEERTLFLEKMGTDSFIDKQFIEASANSLTLVKNRYPNQEIFQFYAVLGLSELYKTGLEKPQLQLWQNIIRWKLEKSGQSEISDMAMVVDEDGWNELTEFTLVRISATEAA